MPFPQIRKLPKPCIFVHISVLMMFVYFSSALLYKRLKDGPSEAHVATVLCGDRLEDAKVMTSSLLLTSKRPVVLHVFVEKRLQNHFKNAINLWPNETRQHLQYKIYDIFLPTRAINGIPSEFWSRHFSPCNYQRLFLAEALPNVDKVIYMDADTLFLAPVHDLFAEFGHFDRHQQFGLAPEQLSGGKGFYSNFKKHPIYGSQGVNSGVILLDLGKIRKSRFLVDMKYFYQKYRSVITLGDQGILNIMFHFQPERLFLLSCGWNFRSDFCTNSTCTDAGRLGARVLHGNRRAWHTADVLPFRAVYAAFRDTPKGNHSLLQVLSKTKLDLKQPSMKAQQCSSNLEIFTMQLEHILMGNTHNSLNFVLIGLSVNCIFICVAFFCIKNSRRLKR